APHLSSSVAEARLHRSTNQNDYWQSSQTAATYAGTKVYNPYAIRRDIVPSADATTQYNGPPPVEPQLAPSAAQDVVRPGTFGFGFSSSSANDQSVAEHATAPDHYQYLAPSSTPSAPCYQAECNASFSHPASRPHTSESPSTLSFAEAPLPTSTADYAYIEPAQPSLYSTDPSSEPNVLIEEPADMVQYNYYSQPDPTPPHSRPVSGGFTYSNTAIVSRPHSSYNSEYHAFPPYMIYNERRGSIASSVSPDDTFAYQVRGDQDDGYASFPGYDQHQRTTYSPTILGTSPSSNCTQPQTISPPPHTPVKSPPHDDSVPGDHEHSQPAPRSAVSSPLAPEIGPPKSVHHRLEILMDAQRQHAEQREGVNQPPNRASKKPVGANSRRRKRTQSSDDDESDWDSKSTTTSKSKNRESASRYKAAYERVRSQRNFFQGAVASLIHQVRILGGDPMQASDLASKVGDIDPKTARLLIASLQQDLETSREKVIEIQTDLHKLRKIVEDTPPRVYRPSDDEDRAPLSAAPVTILGHLNKLNKRS
ncbi:hypothetical protein FRC07_011162, partial [Ceratobasidium sp. 392]